MIGVLQMSENMFMNTAKTGESNPVCMSCMKLTPIMYKGSRKTAFSVNTTIRKEMTNSNTKFIQTREKLTDVLSGSENCEAMLVLAK
jgi:protein-arginine kinase activator protein McsA